MFCILCCINNFILPQNIIILFAYKHTHIHICMVDRQQQQRHVVYKMSVRLNDCCSRCNCPGCTCYRSLGCSRAKQQRLFKKKQIFFQNIKCLSVSLFKDFMPYLSSGWLFVCRCVWLAKCIVYEWLFVLKL